ncbi:MAG TPA: SDR family oxidoreductase [Vicinamibacterales bacterium]|nr:SDR family oxidoreductase [Vicinamibacterales bacterium]
MNAVVTGGSRGIGFAIARALVLAGGRVLITGRHQGHIDRAAAELAGHASARDHVIGAVADARDRQAIDAAMARAAQTFGSIDTLVNNAGVGIFRPVDELTDADWHQVIDTNLTGVFYATRAAIPFMKRAGGGWIINIASLAGRNYFASASAYCASKAGLVAFTEAVMLEVREHNIRVSCIMPGSVGTEFNGRPPRADEGWKLAPDDIAEVVMDLLRHPARSLPSKIEIRPARTR